MDQNNSQTISQKIKDLYKRPGGLFAKITGVLAIGGIGFGLYKALPFLVAAAQNVLILVLECIGIAGLLFLIFNKDFRRAIKLLWLQIMRKLYGLIVNIDPIAILKNGVNEMKQKLKTVRESVTKLESLLVGMKQRLEDYENDFEHNIAQKKSLEKKGIASTKTKSERQKYQSSLQLINNNIARGDKQITNQRKRIATLEKYLDVMKTLENAADFRVRDAECELDYREKDYKEAKLQTTALRSITSIFNGGFDKTMEMELAMSTVTDTINESIAEMNRMLDGSNDILTNFEIDSDINAEKADKILEMFENNGFSIFDDSESQNESMDNKYILNSPKKPDAIDAQYVEVPVKKELPAVQTKYFQ